MTAPAYDPLTNDDLGADKILTTGTANALDTNPVAIAQRGANAPVVQVPVREYKTSGTAATWTIPDGVTAFNVYVIGGGGEGAGNGVNGSNGGDSSVVYNAITYTGGGGEGALNGASVGFGGVATGGDLNLSGTNGYGDGTTAGFGGAAAMFGGTSYGAGGRLGFSNASGGGGAGLCIKRIVVVAGQTTATYTVGAGGTGSGGTDGAGGLVIFEY